MLMEGGTIEDWARAHVSIGFSFEPWGTKKTIEHIFDERNVRDDALLDLAKKEADKMVTQRYLPHLPKAPLNSVCVFAYSSRLIFFFVASIACIVAIAPALVPRGCP